MLEIKYDQEALRQLCDRHQLKLLVLHGSYAKGQATTNSDIDIGVLRDGKVDYKEYSAILKDFGGIFGDKFDPAFLNNAEPMICYHVAVAGQPLFEHNKGAFSKYKLQAISRYMDTKKFRDLEKRILKTMFKGTPHD